MFSLVAALAKAPMQRSWLDALVKLQSAWFLAFRPNPIPEMGQSGIHISKMVCR